MRKYFRVIQNTWDEMTTYRLSFVLWRLRTILQLLTIYFLWVSVVPLKGGVFGYSQSHMLTYILGGAFLNAVIFSTRTYEIGDNITSGNLSTFLIKPMSYFRYWFARDIGDKLMNISFAIVELSILFFFLKPPFLIQADIGIIVFTILAVFFAFFLYFLFGCLLGMIGFWSSETWAIRFIFYILVTFFAGFWFPLDIFPKGISLFFQMLPFSYMLYFPLKVYLGQLEIMQILMGLSVSILWVLVLYFLLRFIWLKGLKVYTAYGH